jgi:hypothetical protein
MVVCYLEQLLQLLLWKVMFKYEMHPMECGSFVFLVLLFIKVTYGLLSHKVELKSWWENWVAILLEQFQF